VQASRDVIQVLSALLKEKYRVEPSRIP